MWKTSVHYINDIWLGLWSNGMIGTGRIYDPQVDKEGDGAPAPRPKEVQRQLDIRWTPSLEFPPRTENDYLASATLGVGRVRGIDTLVVWSGFGQLLSYRDFSETSNLRTLGALYDPNDRAEQQFYLNLNDTSWFPAQYYWDSHDQRRYISAGIEVHQTSYAWSMRFAKRFVLIDYWIVNVTDQVMDGATSVCTLFPTLSMTSSGYHRVIRWRRSPEFWRSPRAS